MHTLGPLNALIQSEAVIEVSESDFDSETLKLASHWIGVFKGPNMCAQMFSRVSLLRPPIHLMLVHERGNLWVPGY